MSSEIENFIKSGITEDVNSRLIQSLGNQVGKEITNVLHQQIVLGDFQITFENLSKQVIDQDARIRNDRDLIILVREERDRAFKERDEAIAELEILKEQLRRKRGPRKTK